MSTDLHNNLRVSVIISTYNSPRSLALALAGLRRQTLKNFEVLIADDGSDDRTREVIEANRKKGPFEIRHIRHEHDGFRKWAIVNKAILAASGNYLVIQDGDCVPPARCLEIHCRNAREDRYITGGKILLNGRVTESLTEELVADGALDRVGAWWFGVRNLRRLAISQVPGLRYAFNRMERMQTCWRGENSSTFAANLRRIGGFDERFTYGYGDADLGHRLDAAGILGFSVRYTIPMRHLEHDRPYVSPQSLAANKAIYDANRAVRMTRTPYGLPENS
jgi:glycosyltransferase involved in cell wall biosynthesis